MDKVNSRQRPARVASGSTHVRWICCGLAGALAGLGMQARAQPNERDDRALTALSLEQLMEIPVSASAKQPQSIREAAAVGSVITQDQIGAYGWLTLNDVLFRQPGFAPAQDYERITVGARGLYEGWNNNHLLMLMDGVPFNNASNGTAYTWDVLPLFMVERVEILRGPGSALYGTNATNGVVALDTRSAGPGTELEGRARWGNAATQTYDLFGSHLFPYLGLVAAYTYQRTDGNGYASFDGSGRRDASGALEMFQVADARSNHYAFVKLEGRGPLAGLSMQMHYQYWHFQTGHGWLYQVPDAPERVVNSETRAWLTYRPHRWWNDRLALEVVAQAQHHVKDYRIKYLPDGATLASVTYPDGVIERIKTGPYELFGRVQLQLRFWREMQLMLGLESSTVFWGRDALHQANVNINYDGDYQPFPNGEFRTLDPALEAVLGKPLETLGTFLQYTSGRVLDERIAATAGLRYDVSAFDYVDLTATGQPQAHRSFSQLSPRLGLVAFPHEALTLKAMAERAFRAPSPSELVIYNTLLASSNIKALKPEELTTLTLAADLQLLHRLNLRADGFYEHVANQIAFSATKNTVANVYTRSLAGLETELLFDLPLDPVTVGGFANYTFTHLIDETIDEPGITPSGTLTWAPAHVANVGVRAVFDRLEGSVQGHFQGRVLRRDSDRLDMAGSPTAFSAYRPASVAPWFELDARVSCRLAPWARVGVQGTNLLDRRAHLVKTNDYPFDFRLPGIRVLATVELATEIDRYGPP